jgi:hypothetical protein
MCTFLVKSFFRVPWNIAPSCALAAGPEYSIDQVHTLTTFSGGDHIKIEEEEEGGGGGI